MRRDKRLIITRIIDGKSQLTFKLLRTLYKHTYKKQKYYIIQHTREVPPPMLFISKLTPYQTINYQYSHEGVSPGTTLAFVKTCTKKQKKTNYLKDSRAQKHLCLSNFVTFQSWRGGKSALNSACLLLSIQIYLSLVSADILNVAWDFWYTENVLHPTCFQFTDRKSVV